MTSRERLLTALNRGQPDRLPGTIHCWQDYYLNTYLGGIDQYEAFRKFGLDASIYISPMVQPQTADWVTTTVVTERTPEITRYEEQWSTPEGTLVRKMEANAYTSWITEYPIKEPEQIYLLQKYLPVPKVDAEIVQKAQDHIGEDGIVRSFGFGFQPGIWQDACQYVGTEKMILATFDDPTWVHEFLEILLEKKLQYAEKLKGVPLDLVETGGGDASTTVISPKLFREFCLPYDKLLHAALHDAGMRVVYHTCGGMMPILESIVENGCDAIETLTPKKIGGDVNLGEVKRRVGDKVCMIGGMNQFHGLQLGTPETVKRMVRRAFEEAGAGGGYILSTCDHFFEAPIKNLEAYGSAAKEVARYH